MGYFDLIYDTNPDLTLKNQLYYDKEGLPFSDRELTEQIQVSSIL